MIVGLPLRVDYTRSFGRVAARQPGSGEAKVGLTPCYANLEPSHVMAGVERGKVSAL